MIRTYLATWCPDGSPALAPRLFRALETMGCARRRVNAHLTLYATSDLPIRSTWNHDGVMIGQAFDRTGQDAPDRLERGSQTDEAEELIHRYWGQYAVLSASSKGLSVIREPSGGLPVYHAVVGTTVYLTSAPHLLIDHGLVELELDWYVITRSLVRHADRTSLTALSGIAELLPGEAATFDGASSAARAVWDPWQAARQRHQGDESTALRETLLMTLGAMARQTERPLVEVSGGLDSAIVAAVVAAAAPQTSLITFSAAPGDPDETLYARALAAHLGRPLAIARPSVDEVDLTRSLGRDLPRPNARAFVQAADAHSLRHARETGADAFFSGGGGDDVFCFLRTILPAIDRFLAHGLIGTMKTGADIAEMNHATVWDVAWKVVRRALRGSSRDIAADGTFLTRAATAQTTRAEHQAVSVGPPGKAAHVAAVLSIHNYLEGHARAAVAPILSPLMAQPVIECCLAIPTWRWCAGGRNRAVARDACAGLVPTSLLDRKSKGSFDGFGAQLFDRRRTLIGEMLMDGSLARQQLIDREAVSEALGQPFPSAETVGRLLALVDAESWVSSWLQRSAQRG